MYEVKEINKEIYRAACDRWKSIAKPLHSLGVFEEIISKIAAIEGTLNVDLSKRRVIVMCADNGIVKEGVTQTDSSVTATVAENIVKGDATVCHAAKVARTDITAIDVGVARDTVGTVDRKIAYGTKDFLLSPAMTREETEKAVSVGIDMARESKEKGYNILAVGEMGIGNTTTSSAVASVILDEEPREMTGRGAGLSDTRLKHKIAVIEKAIALHKPDKNDIIGVLSKVGGMDIAAMTGVFIGGAMYGLPVIIDGFISSVAALCAKGLRESSVNYMIASHTSHEKSAKKILDALNLKAPIKADMFPGEGTGAVMLLPLLDTAAAVFKEMPTFEDIDIERYKEYK